MTTTLLFNDLTPMVTAVDNQYSSKGIIFSPSLPVQWIPGPGSTSRWLVQSRITFQSSEGRTSYEIAAQFTDPRHSIIQCQIIHQSSSLDVPFHFEALGNDGSNLGVQTIMMTKGNTTAGGLFVASTANIASFTITLNSGPTDKFFLQMLAFDDLNVPHTPDFRLLYSGSDIYLRPGDTQVINVNVVRLFGLTSNIFVGTTLGTPDTSVQRIFPSTVLATQTSVAITVSAPSDAVSDDPSPANVLTISGTFDESPINPDHILKIPVNVIENFDLEIVGMEITQGIQIFDLPTKTVPGESGIVVYNGIPLVADRPTAVRVFCRYTKLPSGHLFPTFDIRLHGGHNNDGLNLTEEFPDSPLWNSQTSIVFTDDVVQRRIWGGTSFVLPPSWTMDSLALKAEIVVPEALPTPFPPPPFETNTNNNAFVTTGITFTRTKIFYLTPIKLTVNDPNQSGSASAAIASPDDVFSDVKKLYPISQFNLRISPYFGTVDVTTQYQSSTDETDRSKAILDKIHDAVNHLDQPSFLVGVFSSAFFANTIRGWTESWNSPKPFSASIVQDTGRPRNEVCHEIGHLCNRNHASAANNADPPIDDWPPDQLGWLQGVAYDFDTDKAIYPRQFGNDVTKAFDQWWDFMSYAAAEDHSWLSPRGWEETLNFTKADSERRSEAAREMSSERLQQPEKIVTVTFWEDSQGNVVIGKTREMTIEPKHFDVVLEPSYQVLLKDTATGNVLARGKAFSKKRSSLENWSLKEAALPFTSYETVGAVEVLRDNAVVASQIRPLDPPAITSVSVVEVSNHDKCYHVYWTTESSVNILGAAHISVLTSPEGAADTWKLVHSTTYSLAETSHSVAVPRVFIPYNPSARMRVILSNDFSVVTSAISPPFSSPGSPPTVDVVSPKALQGVKAGTNIYLHVDAFDDKNEKIKNDRNIVWACDGQIIAKGMLGTWKTPSDWHGKRELNVRVVDFKGRKSEQTILIWFQM